MVKPYHKLLVWQRAHQFAKAIYAATRQFPREEQFGLVSQLRRAAVSVPANIVEGHIGRSRLDYRRFLAMAQGSLAECEYYLELTRELGFIDRDTYTTLERQRGEVSFLLNRLVRSTK